RIRLIFGDEPTPVRGTKRLSIRVTAPTAAGPGGGAGGGTGAAPRLPAGGGGTAPGVPGGGIRGGGIGGPGMLGGPGSRVGFSVGYEVKETDGKQILVLKRRSQDDFEVPFRLVGDTLTLNGGVYEVGGRGGRPGYLKVELKGEWKRVDTPLEGRIRKPLPEVD